MTKRYLNRGRKPRGLKLVSVREKGGQRVFGGVFVWGGVVCLGFGGVGGRGSKAQHREGTVQKGGNTQKKKKGKQEKSENGEVSKKGSGGWEIVAVLTTEKLRSQMLQSRDETHEGKARNMSHK